MLHRHLDLVADPRHGWRQARGRPLRPIVGRQSLPDLCALLSWAGTVLATAGVVFTLLTLPLSTVVTSTCYIQYIDPAAMVALARDKNLVIRLLHKPGHFVRCGEVVALVWPAGQVDKQHTCH